MPAPRRTLFFQTGKHFGDDGKFVVRQIANDGDGLHFHGQPALYHFTFCFDIDRVASNLIPFIRSFFIKNNERSSRIQHIRKANKLNILNKEQREVEEILFNSTENIVVQGAAGTGKSLLAFRVAVKEAQAKKTVLFVMRNNPLKQYEQSKLNEYINGSEFGVGDILPDIQTFASWQRHSKKNYDAIVIDEAQDFSIDDIKKLKNYARRLICFIDPNQSMMEKVGVDDLLNMLSVEFPHTLTHNYRNSQQVIDFSRSFFSGKCDFPEFSETNPNDPWLCGISCGDDGNDYYEEQNYHIENIIEGNEEQSIGIFVSPKSLKKTAEFCETIRNINLQVYNPKSKQSDKELYFDYNEGETSVYILPYNVVKGLEFDVVIMTRVGRINKWTEDISEDNLFYMAITRAKEKLFILYNKKDSQKDGYLNAEKLQQLLV